MVLALIFVIVIFVLIAFFAGFNLQNVCDIWFFGKTFHNVPVFITVLISFAAGVVVTLPAVLFKKQKKLTPEQARAQADRLEQRQKKQAERAEQQQKRKLERQLKQQKKLESQIILAQNGGKKPKKEKNAEAPQNTVQEETT